MRSLISDLLDVAYIETGTLSISPEPSDTARLVDEAKILFLSAVRRNSIRMEFAPGLPQVMADRRRIVQVLYNLLSNAAKYSNDLSTISVSAVREAFQVAISVADEGRGIPAERLPFLFRRFSQIDGEERSGLAGSGLGLEICKGIVEAHGGRIWAESDGPGLGSRFTFTVPVVETDGVGDVDELDQQADRPELPVKGRTRVLAVDDDPQALRYVRAALAKAGYEPIVTGDPDDVDRLIEEKEPHLLLLDLMLPGVDGIELMESIQRKFELPVIFLSAYGQESIIARAFDNGAADYVVKPFAPTELAARIRAALRRGTGAGHFSPRENYVRGDLVIDYVERRTTVAGRVVELTVTEYALLYELSTNAGMVLTYKQLLKRIWDEGRSENTGVVRTVVTRLRDKAGGQCAQPRVYLHRAASRLPHAEGRGAGEGAIGERRGRDCQCPCSFTARLHRPPGHDTTPGTRWPAAKRPQCRPSIKAKALYLTDRAGEDRQTAQPRKRQCRSGVAPLGNAQYDESRLADPSPPLKAEQRQYSPGYGPGVILLVAYKGVYRSVSRFDSQMP